MRTRSSWTRPPTPTSSTGRAFRSWLRPSPGERSALDPLRGLSIGRLREDPGPEADVLALVPDAALQRPSHAVRHAVPSQHRLVRGQTALVAFELGPRQRFGIRTAGQFQQAGVTKLIHVGLRVGTPPPKRLAPGRGQAVDASPPSGLLALLVEQAGLGQASALGVDLSVGDRPEVEDAHLCDLLELVRGRGATLIEEGEDRVGGVGETWRIHSNP